MFSLNFQEKIRKPVIGLAGLMNKIGLAGFWFRLISATQRFIIWRSPFIKSLNPDNIIDIGANTGEFALLVRAAFPNATIISFEPQPKAYEKLVSVMRKDKNFKSFCLALGEKDDKVMMNISKFSPSSSLIAKPADSYVQEIEMQKLDNFSGLIENKGTTIVKMDVEGYEYSILKGGQKFISNADWLYIECRTTDLIGCKFSEIYDLLISKGWEFHGAYDSEFSKKGKLVYFDALFKNLLKVNN